MKAFINLYKFTEEVTKWLILGAKELCTGRRQNGSRRRIWRWPPRNQDPHPTPAGTLKIKGFCFESITNIGKSSSHISKRVSYNSWYWMEKTAFTLSIFFLGVLLIIYLLLIQYSSNVAIVKCRNYYIHQIFYIIIFFIHNFLSSSTPLSCVSSTVFLSFLFFLFFY